MTNFGRLKFDSARAECQLHAAVLAEAAGRLPARFTAADVVLIDSALRCSLSTPDLPLCVRPAVAQNPRARNRLRHHHLQPRLPLPRQAGQLLLGGLIAVHQPQHLGRLLHARHKAQQIGLVGMG